MHGEFMSNVAINEIEPGNHLVTASRGGFVAIPVAVAFGLPNLHCDFYIQPMGASRKVLYRSADTDVPIGGEEKYDQRHFRHVYIRSEDRQLVDQALREALATAPESPAMHVAFTLEQHRETFQLAFKGLKVAPVVAAAENIATDLLQIMRRDDFSIGKVVSLLDHDQCTFQHSCNVSIYSAALARHYGLSDEDVALLTTGGLLHDIGKRQIPGFLLRKLGRLDNRERELIRKHPAIGFRELTTLNRLNWAQLMMTYQHHEWINGTGYPVGIMGDEIHLWARICAIADVFDALTANRPYRETDCVEDAMGVMSKDVGHFDSVLFRIWQELVRI